MTLFWCGQNGGWKEKPCEGCYGPLKHGKEVEVGEREDWEVTEQAVCIHRQLLLQARKKGENRTHNEDLFFLGVRPSLLTKPLIILLLLPGVVDTAINGIVGTAGTSSPSISLLPTVSSLFLPFLDLLDLVDLMDRIVFLLRVVSLDLRGLKNPSSPSPYSSFCCPNAGVHDLDLDLLPSEFEDHADHLD